MFAYLLPILFFCSIACAQEDGRNLSNQIAAVIDTVHTTAGSDFVVERTEGVDPRYETVIKRLVKDGWDEAYVREIFSDSRTVYIPKMVTVKPRKKVDQSNWYTWVNTEESSKACIDFIKRHDSLLNAVEKQYGVDKETIAALLRCETKHGTVTGDYHVLSVYASMTLMSEAWAISDNSKNAREIMKEGGKTNKQINDEIAWIKSRSKKRGNWAYKELDHLLKIHKAGKWDVRDLYGSWAGAFGWAQFLPSSYRRLATDGNGDGKIDLYSPSDAIHSVANYLSKGGYRSGNATKIKKALKSYNPSSAYANSIYALSVRVQKDMAEQ
ncbi:MAG: lytic murein transglycosylase [Ignavibacteria bacterium]|nr:lytic murein transglycosylase [Ignavibacteria bacterium]